MKTFTVRAPGDAPDVTFGNEKKCVAAYLKGLPSLSGVQIFLEHWYHGELVGTTGFTPEDFLTRKAKDLTKGRTARRWS